MRLASQIFERKNLFGAAWTQTLYNSEALEHLLIQEFKEELLLDSCAADSPRLFAVSALTNKYPPEPFLFRNYKARTPSRYNGCCLAPVWEGLRASTAAPPFFSAFKTVGVEHHDGALVANNPAAMALHEMRCIWGQAARLECLVSIGTGRFLSNSSRNWSIINATRAMFYSATNSEGVHEALLDLLPPNSYFRFNPLIPEINMEESDSSKLLELQELGARFVLEHGSSINAACKLLNMKQPSASGFCSTLTRIRTIMPRL